MEKKIDFLTFIHKAMLCLHVHTVTFWSRIKVTILLYPLKSRHNFLIIGSNSKFPTLHSYSLQRHSFDIHTIISIVCHTKWCIVYGYAHTTQLLGVN